jgi:hypothetical protein
MVLGMFLLSAGLKTFSRLAVEFARVGEKPELILPSFIDHEYLFCFVCSLFDSITVYQTRNRAVPYRASSGHHVFVDGRFTQYGQRKRGISSQTP